jgi:hypothetical protein
LQCVSAAVALHEVVLHRPKDVPVGECDAVHDAARVFPIEVRLDAPSALWWLPARGAAL